MKKLITRRVAIGTAIGGLTAGAIVLRSVRRRRLEEADPYGKIDLSLDGLESDLSPRELADAFEVIEKERDMWLRFKGVAGRTKVVRKTEYTDKRASQTLTDEGYASLSLDLEPSKSRGGSMLIPTDVKLVYSGTQNSPPVWSFSLARRDSQNPVKFDGKEIDGISSAELYSLLTAPLSVLLLPNEGIREIAGSKAWKVSRNGKVGAPPDSYVFESNGKVTSDGLLPTLGFTKGHLSKFVPKRNPDEPFDYISLDDHVVDKGIAFPTTISLSTDNTKNLLPEIVSLTVSLSDIQISTT